MKISIIIPAHNEESYLAQTLQSLVEQTFQPFEIIVVNDHSTDNTQKIIDQFSSEFHYVKSIFISSEENHQPGSKVINAFNEGFKIVNSNYEIICKFDADLIFPKNYLEVITSIFNSDKKIGMAGGFCYIEKNGDWVLENLTNKDHIRGALKAYRKNCFENIGGLKVTMGWDTVDELLAKYNGWNVITNAALHVKHLKPTGKSYTKAAKFKQGEAFYKMRYGFWLTTIASAKLAIRKKSFSFFLVCLSGYRISKSNKTAFIVSEVEGKYIRSLRWKGIRSKLF